MAGTPHLEFEKDIVEIPANIRHGLKIVPVSHVDEVLALALADHVTPIDWTEDDELASTLKGATAPDGSEVQIRH